MLRQFLQAKILPLQSVDIIVLNIIKNNTLDAFSSFLNSRDLFILPPVV